MSSRKMWSAGTALGANWIGFQIRLRPRKQAFRRANYAAGGAREERFEGTGETTNTESSGSGSESTGLSTAVHWLFSVCAAAWWLR